MVFHDALTAGGHEGLPLQVEILFFRRDACYPIFMPSHVDLLPDGSRAAFSVYTGGQVGKAARQVSNNK